MSDVWSFKKSSNQMSSKSHFFETLTVFTDLLFFKSVTEVRTEFDTAEKPRQFSGISALYTQTLMNLLLASTAQPGGLLVWISMNFLT